MVQQMSDWLDDALEEEAKRDWLNEKLEEARKRSQNYGRLRGAKETADDYLKGVYATLYENAPEGSVAERDSWVKRQPDYKNAVIEKQNRYAEWTAAELHMKILFAEVEKYRTDAATARSIDRAHT